MIIFIKTRIISAIKFNGHIKLINCIYNKINVNNYIFKICMKQYILLTYFIRRILSAFIHIAK